MDVLHIPGYAAAVLQERLVRDAAFLGVTESIGPFEVVPLTLRHWLILRLMHSPLLTSATPTPQDVVNFLWLLSPQFSPTANRAKWFFERRCRRAFFPPRYCALVNTKKARAWHAVRREKKLTAAAKIIDAARAFVNEAMQDRPPVPKYLGFETDYYSDGAYFCALFGREFGWTQDETLAMPIKRVFQYLNEIKEAHGKRIPLMNPSDRLKSDWMRSVNTKKQNPSSQ